MDPLQNGLEDPGLQLVGAQHHRPGWLEPGQSPSTTDTQSSARRALCPGTDGATPRDRAEVPVRTPRTAIVDN